MPATPTFTPDLIAQVGNKVQVGLLRPAYAVIQCHKGDDTIQYYKLLIERYLKAWQAHDTAAIDALETEIQRFALTGQITPKHWHNLNQLAAQHAMIAVALLGTRYHKHHVELAEAYHRLWILCA